MRGKTELFLKKIFKIYIFFCGGDTDALQQGI